MKINENYLKLNESYLFSTIAKKVKLHNEKTDKKYDKTIRLGIGDVTLPLFDNVTEAMKNACDEQTNSKTFKGYGEEQGYDFLREKIKTYYENKEVALSVDEIFISDGAKSDLGNILDLFSQECSVLIPDPVYPVYVDTNVMAGRKIIYASSNAENGFLPMPKDEYIADIIYICSPNNPTGAVYDKKQLELWVDFAIKNKSVILFDSAYEAFIRDEHLPTSIYEIKGAKRCAIEFCSLSKTAGFTGTRCGYTIVPNELVIDDTQLNKLWLRRQTTKFNGVSYIVQKGAEAVFSEQGLAKVKENIDYYLNNAKIMMELLDSLSIRYVGGKNSPYIWLKCPNNMESWEFFDYLLENACVVGTPGTGFGENGKNYFRLSSFGKTEDVIEASKRIYQLLK